MADKGIILYFLWILRHTSRLKPLSLRTRLAEPFTKNKADRASLLHFVWIVWTYQSDEATTYSYLDKYVPTFQTQINHPKNIRN